MSERKIDPKFNIHKEYKRVRVLNPYRNADIGSYEGKIDTWFDGQRNDLINVVNGRVVSWRDSVKGVELTKFSPLDTGAILGSGGGYHNGGVLFDNTHKAGMLFPENYGNGVKEVFIIMSRISHQHYNYLFGAVESVNAWISTNGAQSNSSDIKEFRLLNTVGDIYKNVSVIGGVHAFSASWKNMIYPTLILGYRGNRAFDSNSIFFDIIFFKEKLTPSQRADLYRDMKIKHPSVDNI